MEDQTEKNNSGRPNAHPSDTETKRVREGETSPRQGDGTEEDLRNIEEDGNALTTATQQEPAASEDDTSRARTNAEHRQSTAARNEPLSPPQKRHRMADSSSWTADEGGRGPGHGVFAFSSIDASRLLSEPDQVQAEVEHTLQSLNARYNQLQQQLHQKQQQQQQQKQRQSARTTHKRNTHGNKSPSSMSSRQQKAALLKVEIVVDPPPIVEAPSQAGDPSIDNQDDVSSQNPEASASPKPLDESSPSPTIDEQKEK